MTYAPAYEIPVMALGNVPDSQWFLCNELLWNTI